MSAREITRPKSGALKSERMSEAASESGVVPSALMATSWPIEASWSAPRAMVRVPSERISTTSRATIGGSAGCSAFSITSAFGGLSSSPT